MGAVRPQSYLPSKFIELEKSWTNDCATRRLCAILVVTLTGKVHGTDLHKGVKMLPTPAERRPPASEAKATAS
jgi:hypothetical protein